MAPTPILATKLYIPPPRPGAVRRPRLLARLDEGLAGKLTLICAPAGFGKTTLVSEWLAAPSGAPHAAWLALDEADSDPTRFLTYLVAALRTVEPQVGEGVWAALQSAQPPPPESILATLLNEVAHLATNLALVLDDYHVIDAQAVDDALAFIVEHLPPQMHLVITTREDPRLPLARLRARGQLTEVRSADLRFTPAEAADFLQAMNLQLSAEQVAALEARTEGWIAGLQLAALSMQGRHDISAFIQAFAGDHRYIVDYLVEEVLQRQPEPVRRFLLQTAILERLTGPLCDAVTGQTDSKTRLEALQRGNFFVVPLDDKRRWYRYHHLFADVLAAHLREEQPEQVAALHRRACEWYEQNGMRANAIGHALAAEDHGRAATLIELAAPEMRRSRQEATLLAWLKAVPDELLHVRPVLNIDYAGALLQNGELEGVETRLRDAEQWLDASAGGGSPLGAPRPEGPCPVAEMVVVDQEEWRRLPGWIAIYRAAYALARGHVPETIDHAQRALTLIVEEDHLGRGAAAALQGLAYWTSGDLDAACRSYAEGMARMPQAGHVSDAIGGLVALADMRLAQGRLRDAMNLYAQGLRLGSEPGAPVLRGTADMHVGMSTIYREADDLDAAMQHLRTSQALGEHTGFPQYRYRWRVALARIRQAQGDLDGALELLGEAERLYVSDFSPNVRPVVALQARVWVAQGRLDEALTWARAQGLTPDDDLSYLREYEHITLARTLLACYQDGRGERCLLEAMSLLARLLDAAQAGGRMGNVIEILVVQALARHAHGDLPAALASLQQALALAEPEGYVRLFVDEGPPMARLMHVAAARGILPVYMAKLLSAFGPELLPHSGRSSLPASPAAQPLVEPLSERELEVLRLFQTELSGPDIAQELVIALSTVRTHTKGIYSKLGVSSRRAAVKRAEDLHLL